MTRSNRRKNCKIIKKLIKKLRDDCFNLEKHYKEKITKIHMQLLDKEYYLSSILDFMTLWKVTIILLGTQLYIEVSETCVLMIIKNILRHFFVSRFLLIKNPTKKSFFTRAQKHPYFLALANPHARALHSVPGVMGFAWRHRDNTPFWLVHLYHMTSILDSDWSTLYWLYITTDSFKTDRIF